MFPLREDIQQQTTFPKQIQKHALVDIDHVSEVINRIHHYCKTFSSNVEGIDLLYVTNDCKNGTKMVSITEMGKEPKSAPSVEKKNVESTELIMKQCLPKDGHFVIDVAVWLSNADPPLKVSLEMKAYLHSSLGTEFVTKFCRQFKGDISRTNRRWRRNTLKKT